MGCSLRVIRFCDPYAPTRFSSSFHRSTLGAPCCQPDCRNRSKVRGVEATQRATPHARRLTISVLVLGGLGHKIVGLWLFGLFGCFVFKWFGTHHWRHRLICLIWISFSFGTQVVQSWRLQRKTILVKQFLLMFLQPQNQYNPLICGHHRDLSSRLAELSDQQATREEGAERGIFTPHHLRLPSSHQKNKTFKKGLRCL